MKLRHLPWLLVALTACGPTNPSDIRCASDRDCPSGWRCDKFSAFSDGNCYRPLPRSCVGQCGNGQFCDTRNNVCRFDWKAAFTAPANGARVPVNSALAVTASAAQDPGLAGTMAPPPVVRLGVSEGGAPPTYQDLLPVSAGDSRYAGTIQITALVVYDLTVAVPGAPSQDFLTVTAVP